MNVLICGSKASNISGISDAISSRYIRKNPRSIVHACVAHDGAICSKIRKIVPYHGDSPNTRNGARLRSPCPTMAPGNIKNRVLIGSKAEISTWMFCQNRYFQSPSKQTLWLGAQSPMEPRNSKPEILPSCYWSSLNRRTINSVESVIYKTTPQIDTLLFR